MIPTPASPRGGQHLVERLQPERVEDDLHGRHVRPRDRGERLLDLLHAHAVGRDRPLVHEGVERVEHPVVRVHRRRRAVQLHEVEGVDAEVRTRAVGPGAEVLERVVLGLLRHPPAHLRGDRDARVGVVDEPAADERLAAAVAVDVGGVEERDARRERGVEHGERVVLVDLAPVGAELPGAEADHRDGAAGASEGAGLHGSPPSSRRGADDGVERMSRTPRPSLAARRGSPAGRRRAADGVGLSGSAPRARSRRCRRARGCRR